MINKHILKLVAFSIVGAALLLLAAGGGAMYALAQGQDSGTGTLDAEQGLLVAGVAPDSPAAQAGIRRGDILIQVNNQPVNFAGELISQVQGLAAGDQVEIRLLHGDEERTITATLGDRNGQPYLGVVPCGDMSRMMAEPLRPGATIIEVTPNSPAAQAGLQPNDTITAIDGQPLEAGKSLSELIQQHAPGDTITMTVESAGDEAARQVTVTLGEHPQRAGAPYLGVRFRPFPQFGMMPGRPFPGQPGQPLPEGGMQEMNLEPAIVIRQVTENSPAAAAGLQPDDLITAINGQPVSGPRSLVDAAAQGQPGDQLTLTVIRSGETESREVIVTLAENPDRAGSAYVGVMIGGVQIQRSENGVDILQDMRPSFQQPGFNFRPFQFRFEAPPIEVAPCLDPATCAGNTI
jgi:S1-C subfamily serine protease